MGSETAGGESRLKKLSVARRVTFALLVSVLLAVVVGAVTISAQAQSVTSDDTALRTLLPADTEVNKLLAELVDQETGERGFVITGENSFLQPYTAGRKDTAGLVATLHHELVLRPTDLGLLAMVVSRYDKWLHKFAVPQIKDVTDGHRTAAVAAEKTGRGKVLFDNLRAGVTALSVRIDTEERSLIADVRSRQAETLWLDVAITVCAVLGAAAGLWLLNRWIIRPIKLLEAEVSAVAEGATDHAVV
ncbi:MAG TPA: CHASE3 domain-containing protein, partial [Acidimicrobiales bacterium]|nr:CHASE3 domain-containing protein [Acidimicrobiales bacterium]